jgi:hypothetical protein
MLSHASHWFITGSLCRESSEEQAREAIIRSGWTKAETFRPNHIRGKPAASTGRLAVGCYDWNPTPHTGKAPPAEAGLSSESCRHQLGLACDEGTTRAGAEKGRPALVV